MGKILILKGIQAAREIFASFQNTEVLEYSFSELTPPKAIGADVLISNTRLKINEETIARFPDVQIFATVSSGTDHVDFVALNSANKQFWNSKGANATSVAEYCWVSFLDRFRIAQLREMPVCLLGYGNTGKAFGKILKKFGIQFSYWDPFVPGGLSDFETISEFPILSLHLPLTRIGIHATESMITPEFLSKWKARKFFLNTSRGEVVNKEAFAELCSDNTLYKSIDVFDPEPIDSEFSEILLASQNLRITPHIAGYSQIARVGGTYLLANRLAEYFGESKLPPLESFLDSETEIRTQDFLPEEDENLKNALRKGDFQYFERRRNEYPLRLDLPLEFSYD